MQTALLNGNPRNSAIAARSRWLAALASQAARRGSRVDAEAGLVDRRGSGFIPTYRLSECDGPRLFWSRTSPRSVFGRGRPRFEYESTRRTRCNWTRSRARDV